MTKRMSLATVVVNVLDASGVFRLGRIAFLPVVDHGAPAIAATATVSPAPSMVIPIEAPAPTGAVSTFMYPPMTVMPAGNDPIAIEPCAPPCTAKLYSAETHRACPPPVNTPVP